MAYMKLNPATVLLLSMASVLSAAPRLGLSTTAVGTINTNPGANGPSQTVQALNLGDGALNLTATASAVWLSAAVGARGTCAGNGGNCYAVTIALNTAAVPAGTYTEFITLSDPNAVDAPQDISVTVNTTGVQTSLTAYVTPVGGTTSSALFNVFTTGTGVKGTVTTTSGGNWLTFLDGSSGLIKSPSPWLIQTAAQTGQAPGTYTGAVTISGSSVPTENKSISVTLVVTSSPVIQLNNTQTIRLSGVQGGSPQYSVLNLTNLGSGTLSVTGATGSASFLTASVQGSSGLLITADPTGLAPGIYNGNVTVTSNAANNSQVSIPVELVVAPAGLPSILTGGIVNISTYAQENLAPGDIAAIFGSQFAPAGTFSAASAVPLPKTLANTQVLVNGVPAPLFFVSPGQVNFQVPYSLTGSQVNTVQVVSGATMGNIRSVNVSPSMPRLLTKNAGYGAIVNGADGSLVVPVTMKDPVFATHPAKPGDTIVIYAIGLGQTTPAAVEGDPASARPLQTITNASVTFGGGFSGRASTVTASFTGLTPSVAGLYQLNVVIPDDATLGPAVPVSIVVSGAQSNPVNLAINTTGK
jgi:uncharacterized protein (TIGR03437 family)